jgi:tRNA pseudouridine13 synthase
LSALARAKPRGGAGKGGSEADAHATPPAAAAAAHALPPGLDYAAGLAAVPRTLRMMYLHAWQAALWNAVATARVAAYGVGGAVEGDLVLLPVAPAAADGGSVEPNAGSASGSDAAFGMAEGGSVPSDEHGAAGRLARAHVVTAADAAAGRFSAADVVLPLPGSQVRYPAHAAAGFEFYKATAAAAGIDLATGELAGADVSPTAPQTEAGRRLAAEFDLRAATGDYRRLLHVPADLTWRLLRYSAAEADAPLLPTDWGLLQQQQQQEQAAAAAAEQAQEQEQPHGSPPPRLGLRLEFALPPSGYATMLLRELTKRGTSKAAHKAASLAARPTDEAAEAAA